MTAALPMLRRYRLPLLGVAAALVLGGFLLRGLRAAQTALAIERFRLAHTNALPASLEALVPAYLTCVPLDPYDGQPLRFKLRPPGYVLYSLGQNAKDDGGLELNPKNSSAPHDITFTLEK